MYWKINNSTFLSQPPLAELNLSLPLYIGGVPDIKYIHKDSGMIKGLDGAVQRLIVNGEHWHSLTAKAVRAYGVKKYRGYPCTSDACLNSGVCSSELNSFVCRCPAKFAGKRCEKRKLVYLIRNYNVRKTFIVISNTTRLVAKGMPGAWALVLRLGHWWVPFLPKYIYVMESASNGDQFPNHNES